MELPRPCVITDCIVDARSIQKTIGWGVAIVSVRSLGLPALVYRYWMIYGTLTEIRERSIS